MIAIDLVGAGFVDSRSTREFAFLAGYVGESKRRMQ
jgi:hypothetical protein